MRGCLEKRMRKNKLFTITIICLGLITACTDQGNDNLKGNKSAIEDTGNSEIEEKADAADSGLSKTSEMYVNASSKSFSAVLVKT